jgi:2-keto-3-deoxy-6-phosphogluconate aldolase
MHTLFRHVAVLPELAIECEEDAVPCARALFEGGFRLIEVTLRIRSALAVIATMRAATNGRRRRDGATPR